MASLSWRPSFHLRKEIKTVLVNNRMVIYATVAVLIFLPGVIVCLEAQTAGLPLVKIIATGGTIANTTGGRITGNALISAIPQLKDHAQLEVEEFSRVRSDEITPKMMVDLAKRINQVFSTEDQVAGIVVTVGSNGMEELAYFLHLTVKSVKPVVLTAAQRRHGTLGADGDRNLLDAITVAGSPQARGHGVLAVVNEEIHSARDVTKTIAHRVNAWTSRDLGDLGLVDAGGQVSFYRSPLKKHTTQTEFNISAVNELPNVYIVYSYLGADDVLVRAGVEQGKAQGIVVAAFPTGGVPPKLLEGMKKVAKEGIVVAVSHRGGRGRIGPSSRYPDFIATDNLTPQKARILLMLALTETSDLQKLQRMFDQY